MAGWLNGQPLDDKIQQCSNATARDGKDPLFEVVRRRVGAVYSSDDMSCKAELLKEKYRSSGFAKVKRCLNEVSTNVWLPQVNAIKGDPEKHVKNFQFQLVVDTHEVQEGDVAGDTCPLSRARKPIELVDLFNCSPESLDRGGAEVKNVFLSGNPGTGKTSICKKLAYDWATEGWGSKFEAVYVVSLCLVEKSHYDSSLPRKTKNLETVIANACFNLQDQSSYEAVKIQVKDDLDKDSTLVILDGLDEGDDLGSEMVSSALSCTARCLVLSRPFNCEGDYDREVEVLGFKDEVLAHFISVEMGSDVGQQFTNELRANANVWEIAHVPLTAQLLCTLRRDKGEELDPSASASLYGLYSEIATLV